MGISYTMRAVNTSLGGMVYWESSGQPDFTGISSPFPPGDLQDFIVVQKVSTSGEVPGTAWSVYPYDALTELPIDLATLVLMSDFELTDNIGDGLVAYP